MKEFLLIIKTQGCVWTDLSPEELQAHMEHGGAYIGELMKQGVIRAANPIEKTGSRIINGSEGNLKDGPFNESKELVAGFFHINAKDMNEAIEIAKKNPIFDDIQTTIEVHPLMSIGG